MSRSPLEGAGNGLVRKRVAIRNGQPPSFGILKSVASGQRDCGVRFAMTLGSARKTFQVIKDSVLGQNTLHLLASLLGRFNASELGGPAEDRGTPSALSGAFVFGSPALLLLLTDLHAGR